MRLFIKSNQYVYIAIWPVFSTSHRAKNPCLYDRLAIKIFA